jgi:SnoaL-like polyketide cyclase.
MPGIGPAERARALVDSWNRSDWAAYRAMTDPAYVYEERASGLRVPDVDEVVRRWQRVKVGFPDAAADIVDVLVSDRTTMIGVVWRATHSGPVQTAEGIESPSYKRIKAADVIVVSWRSGRVATEHHDLGFLSVLEPALAVSGGEGCCC